MKKLAAYITIFSMILVSYPFVTKAMTISDVEQQLNIYKSQSPSVLGASATVDSSSNVKSSTDTSPAVNLPPDGPKILMQGLKYSVGSSMIIDKNLKVGQKDITNNSEIKKLQIFLNAFGQNISTDGSFGPMTKKALIAFQKSKGLETDGIVGPNVRKAIAEEIDAVIFEITSKSSTIPGCTSTSNYSTTTGKSCSTSLTTTNTNK